MSGSRRAAAVTAALVVALGAFLGLFEVADYDVGLARATGEWIVEHGAVPRANVMSDVHADFPFVDDKWLFHVLAHAVIDGAGWTAAVLLRMALLGGLALLLLPPRAVVARAPGVFALVAVTALVTAGERFAFRPELFTMLCLAVFGRVLLRPEPPRRREVVLLLGLQVAWTSLHGYWVLGPIVAAAAAAGAVLDARLARRTPPWRLGLLPVALLLAAFVNPYGFALVRSPVDILLDLQRNLDVYRATIVEFAATFADHPVLPTDLVAYRVLLGLAAVGLLLARRRVRLVELLPVAAFFVMSLELRRNVAPFAVVAAPVVARWITDGLPAAGRPWVGRASAALAGALGLAVALGHATDWTAVHDRLDRRFGWGRATETLPLQEIAFVREHAPPGVVFVSFSWGSTFTGEAYPRHTPYVDGNTAGYDAGFLRRYAEAVRGRLDPEELLEEHGVRWFLLKPGHALTRRLVEDERWVPLRLGRRAVVVARRDGLDADLLALDLRRQPSADLGAPGTPPSTLLRRRHPWAELNRARLLGALGRREDAEAACLEAAAIAPRLYEPWHEAGVQRMALERPRPALEAFDAALERAPGAAVVLADRALALWMLRRYDDAAADLRAALERRPDDAVLWFRRALVAKDDDRAREAVDHVSRALELDPGFDAAAALLERLGGQR